jgi:hypothetical protein
MADPADSLSTTTIAKLNRDFYSLEPWSYLRIRLRNLILSAGRGLEMQELLAKGIEVDDFKIGVKNFEPADTLTELERGQQHAFMVTETEVLLHHTAETLLRLFRAHEGDPNCPWIELASIRDFRRFKQGVKNLVAGLHDGSCVDTASEVLLGRTEAASMDQDEWDALAANNAEWLAWLGEYFLNSDAYNAAKHGLGVLPQNIALKVTIDETIDFLDGAGPCLEYLHSDRDEGGVRHWHRTTRWLKPDRSFACIHIGCKLIERLWAVGEVRHGFGDSTTVEMDTFGSPQDLISKDSMTLAKMRVTLK